MKEIYLAVMARLLAEVPALKWIDLDEGQLDANQSERPSVGFPAALVGIDLTQCETLYGSRQRATATVSVRVAQNPTVSRTSAGANAQARTASLERFDLIEAVAMALQDYGTAAFNPLSRVRQVKERRQDGILIYRIEFETAFRTGEAVEN